MQKLGWDVPEPISDEEFTRVMSKTCEFAGHIWEDMGGGMQICMVCETERDKP